jgi:hypothetical protein
MIDRLPPCKAKLKPQGDHYYDFKHASKDESPTEKPRQKSKRNCENWGHASSSLDSELSDPQDQTGTKLSLTFA